MHTLSSAWSVYEGEGDPSSDARSAAQSPLLQRLTGTLPAATLRGCGVRKNEIRRRGAQGVIYTATRDMADHVKSVEQENSQPDAALSGVQDHACHHTSRMPCAVKRLFVQQSDFGRRGVAESVLRESTLLRRINAIQRSAMRSSSGLVDDSCRVVELYNVVEAPHHELCLVLEQCALDLSDVIVDKMGHCYVGNSLIAENEDVAQTQTRPACQHASHKDDDNSNGCATAMRSHSKSYGMDGSISTAHNLSKHHSAHKQAASVRCPLLAQHSLIRYLLRRMLRTVLFLHEHCGVVHRDLKLSNFLIASQGELRLCDFGSARVLLSRSRDTSNNVHIHARARGSESSDDVDNYGRDAVYYTPAGIRTTLLYRAPEQLLGGCSAPAAADVWSLGVIFAELCLQRHLFHANSELAMIGSIWKLLGAPSSTSTVSDPPKQSLTSNTSGTNSSASNSSDMLERASQSGVSGIDVTVSGTLAIKFPASVLSAEGLQLLRGMLCMNPDQRITLRAALQHPFLRRSGVEAEEDDDVLGESLWRQRVSAAWRAKTEVVRVAMPKLGLGAARRRFDSLLGEDSGSDHDTQEENDFAYIDMAAQLIAANDESEDDGEECRGLPVHGFGFPS